MIQILWGFLFSFLAGCVFAPVIITLVKKLKAKQTILHYVEAHKQKQGTPTLGGLIFLLSTTVAFFVFSNGQAQIAIVALAVFLCYGLLGFLDDFIKVKTHKNLGLRAYQKIIGQVGIAVLIAWFVYENQYMGGSMFLPWGFMMVDIGWVIIPFVIFTFLAMTNSANLTDGLDGLAGGVSFVSLIGFTVIILLTKDFLLTRPKICVSIKNKATNFFISENLKEVVMESGVITIEGYAFAGCKKLTDITIPLSVTTIEAYAFYGCESLNTGLKFAESVAPPSVPTLVIGGYVFAECTSMSSFYVPNHVRLIGGYRTGGSTNTGHTFENCINLKTFTFSDDALIATIEEYTFSNTKIEEITLPQSMETLADYAFANCSELKRIVVGREIGAGISTATSAGNNMFEGISNPQLKIYVPSSTYDVYAANKGWNVKTVIKNNVTPDGMFAYEQDDTGGSYVTLTDYRGTEEIVTIPRIVTIQGRDYYVSAIGKYFGNGKIKKIVFESDSFVTSIADYAFSSCTALEEIHLPDSITAKRRRIARELGIRRYRNKCGRTYDYRSRR